MKDRASRTLLTMAVIGLCLSAAGCREDEQGRPMVKEKGVYEGPADQALSPEDVEELKSRADGQKF